MGQTREEGLEELGQSPESDQAQPELLKTKKIEIDDLEHAEEIPAGIRKVLDDLIKECRDNGFEAGILIYRKEPQTGFNGVVALSKRFNEPADDEKHWDLCQEFLSAHNKILLMSALSIAGTSSPQLPSGLKLIDVLNSNLKGVEPDDRDSAALAMISTFDMMLSSMGAVKTPYFTLNEWLCKQFIDATKGERGPITVTEIIDRLYEAVQEHEEQRAKAEAEAEIK